MSQFKYTTGEQIEEMREEIKREKEKLTPGAPNAMADGKNPAVRRVRWKRALRISGTVAFSLSVVLLITVLISVLAAKGRGETPGLFGLHLYSVESGSMEPTLKVGSVILSRRVKNAGNLKKGDIVTFTTTQGDTVTHRIIELIYDENKKVSYRTKGDNPINIPDAELLTPDRVTAVFVAKIPLT